MGQIDLHLDPDAVRIIASGELDIATGPRLVRVLQGACDGTRDVHLDLGEVKFLDITTADAIWDAVDGVRARGCPIALETGPPPVRRTLRLVAVLRARRGWSRLPDGRFARV